MMKTRSVFGIAALLVSATWVGTGCGSASATAGAVPVDPSADENNWRSVPVVEGLDRPWGMVWLPDGRMLITEKRGTIAVVQNGRLASARLSGVPSVFAGGQGGLMDIALHPDFAKNNQIYLTLSSGSEGANRTELVRATFNGNTLTNVQTLLRVNQDKNGGQHFGSRILWLPDNTLLVSVGDGGNPPTRLEGDFIRKQAQNLRSQLGKVLHLTAEGRPVGGNPLSARGGSLVYSYGHRNIQGLARDPQSGRIFANEHGAKGGDELNMITAGKNYGWPLATHSTEYWGPKISGHKSLQGMVDPMVVWTPATAPSGLAFYTGDKFPAWRGQLFSGGLASRDIRRVAISARGAATREVRMPIGERVRDVRQGPDGFLYVLTDEGNGKLLRIEPRR